MDALRDCKILITGPAGKLAFPIAESLALHNEVWGIARFGDAVSRERVEAAGLNTRAVDLGAGEFGDLPRDFDYVVHCAAFMGAGRDFDHALRVNAEGTGFVMSHCRSAKACLVVSTGAVYALDEDPRHLFAETDPLGGGAHPSPTYGVSKIAQEAVARWAAREFGLPTTIARMNAAYGSTGGMPARHVAALLAGDPIALTEGGRAYTPIHEDDIVAQVPKLLSVAGVPATILNWAGDEVVEVEAWCRYMAGLLGVVPKFETRSDGLLSLVTDNTRRRELIGDCEIRWRDGMRRMIEALHPELELPASD